MPDFNFAGTPNFAQSALAGYQAGSVLGRQRRLDTALGGVDLSRPETIMPVLQADPSTGATLLSAASTMAKAHADAASRVALGNLIINSRPGGGDQASPAPGSATAPVATAAPASSASAQSDGQPGDVVVTGQRLAPVPQQSGWSDAERAAIEADPEAFLKIQENMGRLQDNHLKAINDAADAQGTVAIEAAKLPYEQRRAYIQSQAGYLAQHGVTESQIAAFDPTDQNLAAQQTQALGVKNALAEADKARDDARADAAQAETVKQHGIENGFSAARIGLERTNTSIAAGHLAIAQRADQRAAKAADAKPGTVSSGLPAPTSRAAWSALPAGTRYRAPDGSLRIK